MPGQVFSYALDVSSVKVHDGDTVTCVHLILDHRVDTPEDRDLGFNIWWRRGVGLVVEKRIIRLLGIDTPEMKGKTKRERDLAVKARDTLQSWLKAATMVRFDSIEKPDKYGRLLGRIHIEKADNTVFECGAELVNSGLAHPYDGGKKTKW